MLVGTLTPPAVNCNAMLGAETAMMGKEHWIETFGVPKYTISLGSSGGAITTQLGRQLGEKVDAEIRVDESLIGGFIVNVGSRQFDASVKSKLDALRLQLKSA